MIHLANRVGRSMGEEEAEEGWDGMKKMWSNRILCGIEKEPQRRSWREKL